MSSHIRYVLHQGLGYTSGAAAKKMLSHYIGGDAKSKDDVLKLFEQYKTALDRNAKLWIFREPRRAKRSRYKAICKHTGIGRRKRRTQDLPLELAHDIEVLQEAAFGGGQHGAHQPGGHAPQAQGTTRRRAVPVREPVDPFVLPQ